MGSVLSERIALAATTGRASMERHDTPCGARLFLAGCIWVVLDGTVGGFHAQRLSLADSQGQRQPSASARVKMRGLRTLTAPARRSRSGGYVRSRR
jgi:uncharacterized membrane protein